MHLKSYLGYAMAVLAIPMALATFIGMDYFSHKFVDLTGLKVSPIFTGGEIVKTIYHENYHTKVHQEVFAALFGESSEGFIQIDWEPVAALPPILTEEIDCDNDGLPDFRLKYDKLNNTATLVPYNQKVISIAGSYILKERRTVRVNLRK